MSIDAGNPEGPEEAVPAGPVSNSTAHDALAELYESSRAIGMRDCIEDLLDEVLDQAQRLIRAEHAALMLYDVCGATASARTSC